MSRFWLFYVKVSAENQIIFSRYSFVYLLPFFCTLSSFPLYFILFPFVPLFCIYIGVSILCNSLTHSIKKSFLFFSHFTWYQSHGWFWSEPSFLAAIFSDWPSSAGLLRPTFSDEPSLSNLLHRTFNVRPSSAELFRRTFSNRPSPTNLLRWAFSVGSSPANLLRRIFSVGSSQSDLLHQIFSVISSPSDLLSRIFSG